MRPLNLIFLLFLALTSGATFAQVRETVQIEKTDPSKSVTLYPNPATDFVNIRFATLNAHQTKITLFNILGTEVQSETEVIDDHEVRVRVKELSTGYYLIAVRDEKAQFRGTYKFLKR
jgi:hypothetical protein